MSFVSPTSPLPVTTSHRSFSKDLLILLALFVASLLVRIVTAEYVDIGGDNATRWVDAIRLANDMGYIDWSHHNMRWTIMVPLWALLEFFGTNPALYYVLPVLVSSLGTVFIFLIGRQLHSTTLGLCAAALTILFPQMAQTGSQLWPSAYQFTLAAMACWAILAWNENGKTGMLLWAACFYFLAWGARTSTLYYFPGLVFLIWWPKKDYQAAFLFCLFVGLFIIGEWLFFFIDTGNPMGRIGLIKRAATNSVETITLTDYLLNPLKLTKLRGLLPIFILTVIASISLVRSKDRRVVAFVVFHLVFLFFFLYMVSGFSPIRLAQPAGTRYWAAIAPFGLTILLMWLFDIKQAFPKTGQTLIIVLFLAFALFSIKKIPARNSFIQTAEDATIMPPVFAKQKPVLLHWAPWTPNWLESQLFHIIGIKKRRRNPEHVMTAMVRGAHRAIGMFSPDPNEFYQFNRDMLVPVGKLSYKYVPPGTPENTPVGATIFFDRKTAYSVAGESWPESDME